MLVCCCCCCFFPLCFIRFLVFCLFFFLLFSLQTFVDQCFDLRVLKLKIKLATTKEKLIRIFQTAAPWYYAVLEEKPDITNRSAIHCLVIGSRQKSTPTTICSPELKTTGRPTALGTGKCRVYQLNQWETTATLYQRNIRKAGNTDCVPRPTFIGRE